MLRNILFFYFFILVLLMAACKSDEPGTVNTQDQADTLNIDDGDNMDGDENDGGEEDNGEEGGEEDPLPGNISYLALGDSYTIGESVAANERWPVQLVETLRQEGLDMQDADIIATTGWTTGDLLNALKAKKPSKDYDLVSLLIGVNNQYRGYDFSIYEKELPMLLDSAIAYANGDTSRVFVLSIPDYGVTPFGGNGEDENISQEIDRYNDFKRATCSRYGILYFNITDISREALSRPDLIAGDGLHPSGLMYAEWVERIQNSVKQRLE